MARIKGRRRRKNSRQDQSSDDDCDDPSTKSCSIINNNKNEKGSPEDGDATRSSRKNGGNNNKSDLSFAERRELQRKAAAEKRRQKMKCYLCGKTGHVRRECPGILDDGRGESKYTKSNGDAGAAHLKPSKGRKNKKQQYQQKHAGASGDQQATAWNPLALPPGFEKNSSEDVDKALNGTNDTSSSNSSGSNSSSSNNIEMTVPPHFSYFDAGCGEAEAVLDYLRFGRHGHAARLKSKHNPNPHNHTQISRGDAISEYDTAMESVCETTNFGGCILRSYVPPPWKKTKEEGDDALSWSPHDSIPFSWFRERPSLLKFVIGYPCREYDDDETASDGGDLENDNHEGDEELIAGLVQLAQEHRGTVVGFFADLDYTSMPHPVASPSRAVSTKRFERLRRCQLQRLRCTLRAAVEVGCPVQIRIAPGYKACQLSPTPDVVVVGDSSSSTVATGATDGYSQAIRDLGVVLLETSTSFHSLSPESTGNDISNSNLNEESNLAPKPASTPAAPRSSQTFKVHLSCWNGKAEHLVALGGAFPPDQLVFGFDGRLGFSKAVHLHESAFEVSLRRIVLETGGPGVLPPVVARQGGRNAFCHSGHLPFVAEELARHAGRNPRNHISAHGDGGEEGEAAVPTAALVAQYAAATTKTFYGLP